MQHADLAVNVNAVNLKHRLRQIETDERRGHRTISVMKGAYPSDGTAVPETGGTSISSRWQFMVALLISRKGVPRTYPPYGTERA